MALTPRNNFRNMIINTITVPAATNTIVIPSAIDWSASSTSPIDMEWAPPNSMGRLAAQGPRGASGLSLQGPQGGHGHGTLSINRPVILHGFLTRALLMPVF